MSRPTPIVSSTPLCWIRLGPRPRRAATKTQIFNLWIANNSCMQAVKSPPWILVFCVCRDVNKLLHPGLFQVEDVFTIAFTCAVCSSLFSAVFLCNPCTGFWQLISLDGTNKLEFRCCFCVWAPSRCVIVLLILVEFHHAHAVSQTTLICRTAHV